MTDAESRLSSQDKKTKIKWTPIILLVICMAGFLLRTYKFRDWMHFQGDQYRDIVKAQNVLDEGIRELPLLGPKASGTNLFLGPSYYYFQTLSLFMFPTKIPEAVALPDLVFSVLFLLILYYLSSQFLSRKTSLIITFLAAISYLLIQYSRFPWNPNLIPFWGTLLMLSLYKISITEDKRWAGLWLTMLFFSLGIVSQMHFVAFLGFPLVVLVYWIKHFPRGISYIFWLVGLGVLLLTYSPVIISEIKTNGENTGKFIEAVLNKEGGNGKTAVETLSREAVMFGKFFSATIFSLNENEFAYSSRMGELLILISLLVIFFQIKKEDDIHRKKFLWLIFSWFLGFFILMFLLIFKVNQFRFWLALTPLFFIYFGIILDLLFKYDHKKITVILAVLLTVVVALLNITAVWKWYSSLNERIERDVFGRLWSSSTFHQRDLITLRETEEVADYLIQKSKTGNRQVCFNAPAKIGSALIYLGEHIDSSANLSRINDLDKFSKVELNDIKERCEIYWVVETDDEEVRLNEELPEGFAVLNKKRTGIMSVWEIMSN